MSVIEGQFSLAILVFWAFWGDSLYFYLLALFSSLQGERPCLLVSKLVEMLRSSSCSRTLATGGTTKRESPFSWRFFEKEIPKLNGPVFKGGLVLTKWRGGAPQKMQMLNCASQEVWLRLHWSTLAARIAQIPGSLAIMASRWQSHAHGQTAAASVWIEDILILHRCDVKKGLAFC